MKQPLDLWREAGGNDPDVSPAERRERYRQLLIDHGMLVPRCQFKSETTQRRCVLEADHQGSHDLSNTDIFGHPRRER